MISKADSKSINPSNSKNTLNTHIINKSHIFTITHINTIYLTLSHINTNLSHYSHNYSFLTSIININPFSSAALIFFEDLNPLKNFHFRKRAPLGHSKFDFECPSEGIFRFWAFDFWFKVAFHTVENDPKIVISKFKNSFTRALKIKNWVP